MRTKCDQSSFLYLLSLLFYVSQKKRIKQQQQQQHTTPTLYQKKTIIMEALKFVGVILVTPIVFLGVMVYVLGLYIKDIVTKVTSTIWNGVCIAFVFTVYAVSSIVFGKN
jgi:hypothetical protein